MSLDKLKRVIWILQERHKGCQYVLKRQIRKALMEEIGTSEVSLKENVARLKELGWIRQKGRYTFTIEKTSEWESL